MLQKDFDLIVEDRLKKIKKSLDKKGEEYSRGSRFHNFEKSAQILDILPEKDLLCKMMKQLICVVDYVEDLVINFPHAVEEWDEKIGDTINYLILLEAMIRERYGAYRRID